MEEAIIRYLHFMGVILLSSMLIVENLLLSSPLKVSTIKKLVKIDGLYAVGAVLTLGAGLFLWLVVGKPSTFYQRNPIFHIKIGLFLFIALISLFPTRFLLKNRHNEIRFTTLPQKIILIKRFELALLCIIPILATLMAKGIGN
ncbi:MAG: DUF2214 family protein [Methylotenera sp.]|jgi:putative membrane protein